MRRTIVNVFVFVALACFGLVSYLYAQTANFNNCPALDVNWVSQSYKMSNYQGIPPTTQMKRATWIISQDTENNCLFTARRIIQATDTELPPYGGDIADYSGAIYGNGTKITMQARPAPKELYGNDSAVPPAWYLGEFTKFDRKPRKPTEIQFIMNVPIGDFYTTAPGGGSWPFPRGAESGYGVMIPYTPTP